MTHGQHAKTSQLLGCVKHNRRETTWHLRVQTNLDTGLDLEKEQKGFSEIETQAAISSGRTMLF